MMDAETLYDLLPAIYRLRDAEQDGPLKALMAVLAEQVAALEENLAQLYDDQFIETAADWVVPYIGDLIGYRALYGVTSELTSPRAEVANTIAYRRRKGTAAMLEQLARDVTGWDARVVEFFERLATTQYMNHIRPDNVYAPDLRRWEPLERIGTAFDAVAHTADVRHINRRRGKYNIPNIGIFLWRLAAHRCTRSPACVVDATRFTFSPLGNPAALFTDPQTEETITHLAEPLQRAAADQPPGAARTAWELLRPGREPPHRIGGARMPAAQLDPTVKPQPVPASQIIVCDLRDVIGAGGAVTGWAHVPPPAGKVAVDPVLGRLAFPSDPDKIVLVSFHYGFSADMGGGEYERAATFDDDLKPVIHGADAGADHRRRWPVKGSSRSGTAGATKRPPSSLWRRASGSSCAAANGARPTLVLGGELAINGAAGSEVTLNGLLIAGGTLRVTGQLRRLRLRHCTLVPGLALDRAGRPVSPAAPSLIVESAGVAVEIDALHPGRAARGRRRHGDAQRQHRRRRGRRRRCLRGFPDPGAAKLPPPGGELTITNSTIIGKVRARQMPLAANIIFLARLAAADAWKFPVHVDQRQAGLRALLLRAGRLAHPAAAQVPAGAARRCGPGAAVVHVAALRRSRLRPVQPPLRRRDSHRRGRRIGDGRVPRPVPAAARDQPARAAGRVPALWPGSRHFLRIVR